MIAEKKALNVSATRLSTWLGCRLRYYFKYVAGITKPKTGALYVGHAVHGVLKWWNQARWRRQPIENVRQQFDHLWTKDQDTIKVRWAEGEEPDEKNTAWSLLDLYFKESPVPLNEPMEGVEVQLEADLSPHGLPNLLGILDLVRSGGRITDYKTVGQTPNEERAIHNNELQMTIYSVLYRDATGKKEGGRSLHHLVKLKTPKLIVTEMGPMTDQQETRLFRQIESFVDGLERKDFVPSPGMQCLSCQYMPECRRWS